MNASLQTLFTAIGAVAASAVLALALAEEQQVVQLERVEIVDQQAQVVQLPRVVVEGRRVDGVVFAQSEPRLVE